MRTIFRSLAAVLVAVALAGTAPGQAAAVVKFVYERPPASEVGAARRALRDSGLFETAVDHLNATFRFGDDLTIRLGAEDGPLYGPDLREIWFPDVFFLEMVGLFEAAGSPRDEAEPLALDVVEHALYHEIGHALVHLFDLPITGREEDAVDALATVMVIGLFEDGGEVALSAADAFLLQGDGQAAEEIEFWGEHSFDEQRFFAILCLTYGSVPGRYGAEMPPEVVDQADRCKEDWQHQRRSWRRLLKPHRR